MRQDVIYWNKVIYMICDADKLFIYGAGVMGRALKECLEGEPYHKRISGFIVKSMEGNPDNIDGVEVVDLPRALGCKDSLVLAALHERYIGEACTQLRAYGFTNVVPVTFDSDVWSDIRWNWFRGREWEKNPPYESLESILRQELRVYVVHNIADKRVETPPAYRSYEIPIQAGAALAGRRICDVCDDAGENISRKNRQYCELTALYWIWKHDDSKYAGLSHYRRRFGMSEGQVEKLVISDIDVVVTVPVLNLAGVKGQYGHDHEEKDWDVMMEAVKELSPEYYQAACDVQSGSYYYAYNMFIARKEILDDYCAWLFPILSYCEDKIGEKEDTYQNRYPGFLAERLFTIYLRYNRQYKAAVAKKHFIPAGGESSWHV